MQVKSLQRLMKSSLDATLTEVLLIVWKSHTYALSMKICILESCCGLEGQSPDCCWQVEYLRDIRFVHNKIWAAQAQMRHAHLEVRSGIGIAPGGEVRVRRKIRAMVRPGCSPNSTAGTVSGSDFRLYPEHVLRLKIVIIAVS